MEPSTLNETKKCPFCAETIQVQAIKCKHCGEILDPVYKTTHQSSNVFNVQMPPQRKWSPGVAAVLSFFIPGLGQMYKGNVLAGISWLIFTLIGYFLVVIPGLVLHLICIIMAASGDPYK